MSICQPRPAQPAADDLVGGYEDVASSVGSVRERRAHGVVALPIVTPGGPNGRGHRDAHVFALAQQILRVAEPRGEADQGGDGARVM